MKSPIKKPVFNKRIFWDVNFEALDYDKKALALNLNYERVEVARLRDEVMRLKREIELSERIRNHLANQ